MTLEEIVADGLDGRERSGLFVTATSGSRPNVSARRNLGMAAWLTCALIAYGAATLSAQIRASGPLPVVAPELPQVSGRRLITPDLLTGKKYEAVIAGLNWLPDNRRLVMQSPHGPGRAQIVLLDTKTGHRSVLGQGSEPKVSPDGLYIAFLHTDSAGAQLGVMRLDGSSKRAITIGREVSRFAWSPNGKLLVYATTSRPEPAASRTDLSRSSAIVAHDRRTYPPDDELWLVDLSGSPSERRLLAMDAILDDLAWLPSGEGVVFGVNHFGWRYGGDSSYYRLGMAYVDSLSGPDAGEGEGRSHWQTIAKFYGAQQSASPALSPNGRQVAVTVDFDNGPLELLPSLGLVDLREAQDTASKWPHALLHRVTRDLKLHGAQWSRDGKNLFALRHYGPYYRVYRVTHATGSVTQLTFGPRSVEEFALSPNGAQVAMVTRDGHGRRVVGVADVSHDGRFGEMREVATMNTAPAGMRLGVVREVSWASPDGLEMRGLVILPPGYRAGRRYPLVVDVHGGGWGSGFWLGGSLLSWAGHDSPLDWQMWAAKGYVVLAPDYRTTGAYGQAALNGLLERFEFERADVRDILSGVTYLVKEGLADSTRMAILGMSAGAFLTNWVVALTRHRFQAAVSIEGFAEDLACRRADIGCSDNVHWMMGGYPWEVPGRYRARSPVDFTKGVTTPTLFLMGSVEHGGVDWTSGVQAMYSSLWRQGVPARYVRYPDEGHGVSRAVNFRDGLQRAIAWIDRYLHTAASETPADR